MADKSSAIVRFDQLPPKGFSKSVVAIGVFDGVHRGHQALLREAARIAATIEGGESVALTFDPHPAAVFAPGRVPSLLGTLSERAALLQVHGAESVVVADFDRAFAAWTPDEFARAISCRLGAHTVIVGEDFRYGCDRSGDTAALRRDGIRHGFAVEIIPAVFVNGIPARSTTIRQMLSGGQPEEATHLLGRPYALRGDVVHGKQLGRTIGYPTANLDSAPGILVPAPGIYAGWVHLGDERHRAAISIGDNPTVAPQGITLPRTVEAYLLDDFDRDIYGARIGIDFVSLLRPMEKFDGLPALMRQMARDVTEAKIRLSS